MIRLGVLCLVGVVVALVYAALYSGVQAQGPTITVNTTADVVADDGQCTLREAIAAANTGTASGSTGGECPAGSGADTITLSGGTVTLDVGSSITISSDLTLTGAGAGTTIIQAAATPDVADFPVIKILGGSTVAVSGVTIRHGVTAQFGGGISNSGILTLSDSVVSFNTSADRGGGIFNGGGGQLTLVDSILSDNTSTVNAGGGIISFGSLTITGSTVSGNVAGGAGGVFSNGTWTLSNSTISNNNSAFVVFGTATLNNLTMSGNAGTTQVSGTVITRNSIFADNGGCTGTLDSLGFNLFYNTDCTLNGETTGNVTGIDPLLGSLADNGGPTFTHALLPGSSAIDAGSCTDSEDSPVTTDQRGAARPQGVTCDVGAFEFTLSAVPVPSLSQWALISLAVVLSGLSYMRLRWKLLLRQP